MEKIIYTEIKTENGIRSLAMQDPRVETGIIQFGDDWRGLFIRGDNCLGYALDLEEILKEENTDPIIKIRLQSLLELLKSTDERVKTEREHKD